MLFTVCPILGCLARIGLRLMPVGISCMKSIALAILAIFPSMLLLTRNANAQPSATLLDRAEKATLDCLDYSSEFNCDKASGAIQNIKAVSGPPGNECNFEATKLALNLILFGQTEKINGLAGGAGNEYRSSVIQALAAMRKFCLSKK